MEYNCWPRSSIKIFIVCVYGSDYILGNCNNWNGSHRPNGCWGLEFYKSPWTETSLYSSHLKLHKFRCDQKRDGKNLFLPLLNLLPIVLLSQQCLRSLSCKWLIYELHKKKYLFYICSGLLHSFEIWHCYIKRLCEWEERLNKSEQSLPLFPFLLAFGKDFLQWQKYQISFLFVINIFIPHFSAKPLILQKK